MRGRSAKGTGEFEHEHALLPFAAALPLL